MLRPRTPRTVISEALYPLILIFLSVSDTSLEDRNIFSEKSETCVALSAQQPSNDKRVVAMINVRGSNKRVMTKFTGAILVCEHFFILLFSEIIFLKFATKPVFLRIRSSLLFTLNAHH